MMQSAGRLWKVPDKRAARQTGRGGGGQWDREV